MQEDQDLLVFQYNQQNKNFIEGNKKIAENPNLTEEQKREASLKLKPAPLVEEVEEEVIVQNIENEWRDKSVTWSTMDEEAVRAQFDSDEAFNDYKRFMELDDELASLNSQLQGYINPKFGTVYGNMRTKYDETLTKINKLMSERSALIKPYNEAKDKAADKLDQGIFNNRIENRKTLKVSEPAVQNALTYLPTDFSGIKDEKALNAMMEESYRQFVMDDEILKTAWDNIQKAAASEIKKYENELLASNKYDLTTQEGVDAANADLEAYAKTLTLDKFEGSVAYKKRLTDLGTVMDRAMSQTSTAYNRYQNDFGQQIG